MRRRSSGSRSPSSRPVEDVAGIPDLVAVAQGPQLDPFVARFENDGVFATIKDEPRNADHRRRAHGVADHAERLFADRVVRDQVEWRVVPDPVDAVGRGEGFDVDGAGAFQPDRFELLVLEKEIIVLAALIALGFVGLLDGAAGLLVEKLADDAVAGLSAERVKADLLALAGRWNERHGAGDERQLEIALPESARRHRGQRPGADRAAAAIAPGFVPVMLRLRVSANAPLITRSPSASNAL